jgi:hypothetical protein
MGRSTGASFVVVGGDGGVVGGDGVSVGDASDDRDLFYEEEG